VLSRREIAVLYRVLDKLAKTICERMTAAAQTRTRAVRKRKPIRARTPGTRR
jgi:hypothetical protein